MHFCRLAFLLLSNAECLRTDIQDPLKPPPPLPAHGFLYYIVCYFIK
jgi:hypothetical protein